MARRQRGWAMTLCAIVLRPPLMGLTKRDWKGAEHLPRTGGCVVVANHVSEVDFLSSAHFVYDSGRLPRFLAKSELFAVPVLGAIIKSAGQIPVYRKTSHASRAFKAAVAAINDGACIVVYPEGSITRDPDLWPMRGKTGAARIALSTGCPVIPVAQWGAQDVLAPYARRPHVFPRKVMHVSAGPPVDLSAFEGVPLTPENLRAATDVILDDVTHLLEETRGAHAPTTRFDPKRAGIAETGNLKRPQQSTLPPNGDAGTGESA